MTKEYSSATLELVAAIAEKPISGKKVFTALDQGADPNALIYTVINHQSGRLEIELPVLAVAAAAAENGRTTDHVLANLIRRGAKTDNNFLRPLLPMAEIPSLDGTLKGIVRRVMDTADAPGNSVGAKLLECKR